MNPTPSLRPSFGALLGLAAVLGGCEVNQPASRVTDAPVPPAPRPVIDVRRPDAAQAVRADAGMELLEEGRHEDALRVFEALLDENPSLTVAYVGIGRTFQDLGDPARAEPAFARATRLEPRDFDAQFGHGTALQALGRLQEAVRAFQQALVVRPDDPNTLIGLGESFIGLDMPESAISPFERTVELSPEDGEARVALATAYLNAARFDDAIEMFEIALELVGNRPEVIASLVEAYSRAGRYREAANAGQVLVATAPSPEAWERLGRAYFRLGEYDASLDSYRRATDLQADFWPALNGVGVNQLNRWLESGRSDLDARDAAGEAFRASLRAKQDQPKVVGLLTTYGL